MDHNHHLAHAARLAIRGHGRAEPNPMVGCVIVAPDDTVVGWGYHHRCGEAHAEINALRRAGVKAKDSTVYVTLEPCNHTGRTGACSEALIQAGVKRVVIGQLDPHHIASGGALRLRDAGIEVQIAETGAAILRPFTHRITTGLPWVIAKWAQTLDGKVATRSGESQWISNPSSRRMVHRERGRVCAILTGIGTVIADNPQLTARNVRRRRIALRVVIDPWLDMPQDAELVVTANQTPTVVFCSESAKEQRKDKWLTLQDAGIHLHGLPLTDGELPLDIALRQLVTQYEVTNVLAEAGTGLISRLFRAQLVNVAWVFIGPNLLGDECAPTAVQGIKVDQLTDATQLMLLDQRRRGSDIVACYRALPLHNK